MTRTIYAAFTPDHDLWAIGNTEEEARAYAIDRRAMSRDEARSGSWEYPPPETDAEWSAELVYVTMTGDSDNLRVIVDAIDYMDPVAPWCPADLWDSGEVSS